MRKTSYVVTFFVTFIILILVGDLLRVKSGHNANHYKLQNVLSAERPDWLASKPSLFKLQSDTPFH